MSGGLGAGVAREGYEGAGSARDGGRREDQVREVEPSGRTGPVGEGTAPGRRGGPEGRWWRLRLLVRMPLPLVCTVVLALLVLVAVFGAPFAWKDVRSQDLQYRFLGPFHVSHGWLYFLGADSLGRSMIAELVYGARSSFIVACSAVAISAVVGSSIGLFSGYYGGWVDAIVMRFADIIIAFPSLLFAMALLYVVGPSMESLILVLSVSRIPMYMRVCRGQTLAVKEQTFVEASRAAGATRRRIMWFDVLPLVVPTLLTVALLEVAVVILVAAALSFLGVGLQPPNLDWGVMLSNGINYMSAAWWMTVFPGVAIMLTALCANIVSNWLRAIGDPLQRAILTASVTRWSE